MKADWTRSGRTAITFMVMLWLAIGKAVAQPSATQGARVLRVAYFVPADREPEPNYLARLDRVMTDIQEFYREGMKQNGYGPITFKLDRDAAGALQVRMVQGQEPMLAYGKNEKDKVRKEVRTELLKDGIDMDHETAIIFQVLLQWQADRAVEIGPFVGGGTGYKGSALVFDDAKLDADLLSSKEPGGYYNRPCSIGEFNTHYIGGAAHELGHAFGLAHVSERGIEEVRKGRALMGSGNHTYGKERRREGRGAFLTAASALPLSVHPLFTGKNTGAAKVEFAIQDLAGIPTRTKLSLSGRIESDARVVGLVAYNDPRQKAGDYDSLGWTARVQTDGKFQVNLLELEPGDYDLRIRVYGEGGQSKQFSYHYQVDRFGRPDVNGLQSSN